MSLFQSISDPRVYSLAGPWTGDVSTNDYCIVTFLVVCSRDPHLTGTYILRTGYDRSDICRSSPERSGYYRCERPYFLPRVEGRVNTCKLVTGSTTGTTESTVYTPRPQDRSSGYSGRWICKSVRKEDISQRREMKKGCEVESDSLIKDRTLFRRRKDGRKTCLYV